MSNKGKLKKKNLSIILCNFNNNILNHNTNQNSILNNNNTLHKGGVGISEVILLEIVKFLQKLVHIVKNLITLLNTIRN